MQKSMISNITSSKNPSYDKLESYDTLMPLAQPARKRWNSGTGSYSVNKNLEKYMSHNRPPSVASFADSVKSNSVSEAIHFEV